MNAYFNFIVGIQNERSIDAIETSLFLMCLDNALPNPNNLSAESLGAHQLIHGGASKGNINNRWFDKTMQVSNLKERTYLEFIN